MCLSAYPQGQAALRLPSSLFHCRLSGSDRKFFGLGGGSSCHTLPEHKREVISWVSGKEQAGLDPGLAGSPWGSVSAAILETLFTRCPGTNTGLRVPISIRALALPLREPKDRADLGWGGQPYL